MTRSREIRLLSRPDGRPTAANFELAEVELPEPGPGEAQVRNRWMTVDPYMRGRMNGEEGSYVSPFHLGEPLMGGAVGEVIASNDPSLQAGDLVRSDYGWREAFNAQAGKLRKLDAQGLPPEAFLGVAGMPGLTAYVGLLRVAALKPGDVVLVSAAAGAVGSLVCQIAKLKGHAVIGTAGGAEKVRYLTEELGVDAAVDYRQHAGRLTQALAAAAPEGIDVYFENVGGEHLEAALNIARPFARFALCGMISQYNAGEPYGVRNLMLAVGRQIRLQGFIAGSYTDMTADFLRDLRAWIAEGRIKWRETVVEGIENAPAAFIGLFSGRNLGKALVKLS
ncbi:NADP-dependent oxidoreductase [Phenylobacterium sp.]|uniref:NADP-dependent oxidoreductase n=1 Tax=Phenylobacterium sp. TaxID=1871053 RepID=UPI002F3F3309